MKRSRSATQHETQPSMRLGSNARKKFECGRQQPPELQLFLRRSTQGSGPHATPKQKQKENKKSQYGNKHKWIMTTREKHTIAACHKLACHGHRPWAKSGHRTAHALEQLCVQTKNKTSMHLNDFQCNRTSNQSVKYWLNFNSDIQCHRFARLQV